MHLMTRRSGAAVGLLAMMPLGICTFTRSAQAQTQSSVYTGAQAPSAAPTDPMPTCTGTQTVLLIQDVVPWVAADNQNSLGADVNELIAQNKNWCGISSSDLAETNLQPFKEIIIPSAQTQTFYDNLFPNGSIYSGLASWVNAGGILSANLADCGWAGGGWPCGGTAETSYTFVGGVQKVQEFDNTNNIAASSHPVIADDLPCPSGNCAPIVNTGPYTDIDDWGWSSHGYFINLPAGSTVILTDSLGNPVFVEYPYGAGKVIAGMTTTEWRYVGGGPTESGSPSLPQNLKLLANEIAYQDSSVTVITTPPQPVSPNSTTTFTNSTVINQVITIPPGSNMGDTATAFMEVSFIEIPQGVFDSTRLPATAPNAWSGGTPVPPGTTCTPILPDNNCIVIENLCFDANSKPVIPCDITAPSGSLIQLSSKFGTIFPQPYPALIIADDGQNDWANITTSVNSIDPTLRGGTKALNSDEVIVNLGPGFSLSPVSSFSVSVGSFGLTSVTVNSLSGFASQVTLSVPSPASGVSISLSPNPVSPITGYPAHSQLAASLLPFVTPSTFPLTITGTSASVAHSTPSSVTVIATASGITGVIDNLLGAVCINDTGTVRELDSMLSAAQEAISAKETSKAVSILEGFENLIQAQAGKHIATSCVVGGIQFNPVTVLLTDAQSLINSL